MPKLVSEKQIAKIKWLRNVLLVFLLISITLSVYNIFFIYPALTKMAVENTKSDAVRVAKYLAETYMPNNSAHKESDFNAGIGQGIATIVDTFELEELKVFSRTGRILFSSKTDDIGKMNTEPYFHRFVAKGNVYAAMVKKNTLSREGRRLAASVVEIYVPQMKGNKFMGAFEIYYDITDQKERFDKLVSFSSRVLSGVVFGLLAAIVLVWLKEYKSTKERRRVEKALIKSEEKLAEILNSFADFVIVVDTALNIVWANKITVQFFGGSPVGKRYDDLFSLYRETDTKDLIKKCFQDGIGVEDEIEVSVDGRRIDLWYTASVATRSDKGVPETIIVVYRDITEKKQLRAEAVRSGQLAAIGELAAGVAHEINNPINGIINCAQLLIDDGPGQGENAEIFQRILTAGGRIAMIVRNLLSFARDTEDEPQRVSVGSLLSDCMDLTETQIRKDGIDLKIDISDNFPDVRVRSHHIQQVFLNIISNARYALNHSDRKDQENKIIEIKGEVMADLSPPMIRLMFFDNGTGIPKGILNRVCDPFFSSKPAGEGTGLGLSISHTIIKEHGGELKFDSVENAYTRVMIELPYLKEDDFEK